MRLAQDLILCMKNLQPNMRNANLILRRKMIPRIRTDQWVLGEHLTIKGPFFLDTRAVDIPKTIDGLINALPDNCVGLSLRYSAVSHLHRAERTARRRGMRIIWLDGYWRDFEKRE